MKSVVFTAASLNGNSAYKLPVNNMMVSERNSDEIQYSELPGALMLGVDGKLKPLYHGPDAVNKKPQYKTGKINIKT